jgi:hypothetical protein
VDNLYEYGFSYLFEAEDVIAWAKAFAEKGALCK